MHRSLGKAWSRLESSVPTRQGIALARSWLDLAARELSVSYMHT